jgi:DNA-binding SARP family transcriptional activator/Tfp pilus assembly protein PilF
MDRACGFVPSSTAVEFRLLGPLAVGHGDSAAVIPAAKQRVLLAALLLKANGVVQLPELADALWGSEVPRSATMTVRNYVRRLRENLPEPHRSRIATRPGGYLLAADAAEIDVLLFADLQAQAEVAARRRHWADASARLRAALSLWRGEPLADVPSDLLVLRELPRLAEMRMQALDCRIEAELNLGLHRELVPELRALVAENPLREGLRGQLMLALARCGRQAEALAEYQHSRRLLLDELGVEPGPGLRHVHQLVLAGEAAPPDPAPAREAAAATPPSSVRVAPQQLPAAVLHFVGRQDELARLTGLLDQSAGRAATLVISAIGGTAGVGKTALALHWAHQVADRFPDGQLYVNLRGYHPGQPMQAADALAGLLAALGVTSQDVPADVHERAASYRSLLAGRRMLVVLDNASKVDQVRPLLPGAAGCMVIVTSRDSLAGLVARDGAERLDLDTLPLDDAITLLRTLVGARVDAEPAAAADLAIQCARLPLALRVAAELAAARPGIALSRLVRELADEQQRLDLLDAGGDDQTGVRGVFSWSYRCLDADAARVFRLAGLQPGADVDGYAMAALMDTSVDEADRLLETLARAHLLQAGGGARLGMHDLLRAYARELAAVQDDDAGRREALTRLFDLYLHTASAAMDTLFPGQRHRRPRIDPPTVPAPPITGPDAARGWLDAHRETLVAAAAHMAEHGWPSHATRLAGTLWRYLTAGGYYAEAIAVHNCALHAARHSGDRAAEANALNRLGAAELLYGRYQQATGYLEEALALFRDIGDRTAQAPVLGNLGLIDERLGRYLHAIGYLWQALALWQETGDRANEATTLINIGDIGLRLGNYREATDNLQRALALWRETGHRTGEAHALTTLGDVDLRLGRYQQATERLSRALTLSQGVGDRYGEAHALTTLGAVYLRLGRHASAIDHQRRATALFGEIDHRVGQAQALTGLGEALAATGQFGRATTQLNAALDLAQRIGHAYQQARAHNGLAGSYWAVGDLDRARDHWRRALGLFAELGAPEADQVRDRLAEADHGGASGVHAGR